MRSLLYDLLSKVVVWFIATTAILANGLLVSVAVRATHGIFGITQCDRGSNVGKVNWAAGIDLVTTNAENLVGTIVLIAATWTTLLP